MTSDPDYPDAHHGRVGPNQAVTTAAACREGGAKSDRHNGAASPHRRSRFKPSSWGQFRLPRPSWPPSSATRTLGTRTYGEVASPGQSRAGHRDASSYRDLQLTVAIWAGPRDAAAHLPCPPP